jgi:YcaO-like protein with predicted kinase domain
MGITRVANVTGLDCIGIPVVMACRPNSRSVSVAQGKGLSLESARASALMEAVEGYHAEHVLKSVKFASYEELRYTHNLVDMDLLTRRSGYTDDEMPILWIEGTDLVTQDPVWVPFELVHTNYTVGPRPGAGCFPASSNGLASGNHPLEAISHAICEIVERDSAARWGQLNDQQRECTRVNLQSITDRDCADTLEKFRKAGVSAAVWEVTSHVGIPAFLCVTSAPVCEANKYAYGGSGMGCHPTREIALIRALTEAAQSRLTMIAGSRDDISLSDYERLESEEARARTVDLIRKGQPSRNFSDVGSTYLETFSEDVDWELERLAQAEAEHPILIDLSRQEFEVPVVRVVIPGMLDVQTRNPLQPEFNRWHASQLQATNQ